MTPAQDTIRSERMERIAAALKGATDTREVVLGEGVIASVGEVYRRLFNDKPALVVADKNTYQAAGERVAAELLKLDCRLQKPVVFDDPHLHAYHVHVERLQQVLAGGHAISVAVGSGTINDLVKLASHRSERRYMVVATAASMDGYTAYGASITHQGAKQTFFCPAPLAVVADMNVIGRAPARLNAAGYADLVAKVTAGADWMLADAMGVEAIDPQAWTMVQTHLREWAADPEAIRRGKPSAIEGLMEGLLMTGFAMQSSKSSRPASGAEHQFSHLWDSQGHQHQGEIPLHGFKVAIGTLASTLLYEEILADEIASLDVEKAAAAWPDAEMLRQTAEKTHTLADLKAVAAKEMLAKHCDRQELAERLRRLKSCWPDLGARLRDKLIPVRTLQRMLDDAGAPSRPQQIGIDLERLRRSYIEAQQIRRRFTVLDLAFITGSLPAYLGRLFAAGGPWQSVAANGGDS